MLPWGRVPGRGCDMNHKNSTRKIRSDYVHTFSVLGGAIGGLAGLALALLVLFLAARGSAPGRPVPDTVALRRRPCPDQAVRWAPTAAVRRFPVRTRPNAKPAARLTLMLAGDLLRDLLRAIRENDVVVGRDVSARLLVLEQALASPYRDSLRLGVVRVLAGYKQDQDVVSTLDKAWNDAAQYRSEPQAPASSLVWPVSDMSAAGHLRAGDRLPVRPGPGTAGDRRSGCSRYRCPRRGPPALARRGTGRPQVLEVGPQVLGVGRAGLR